MGLFGKDSEKSMRDEALRDLAVKFPDLQVSVDEAVLKQDFIAEGQALVGSIDQGTSSTRFLVFTAAGRIAVSAQTEFTQIFPPSAEKVGWHEHDPIEICDSVVACILAVDKALRNSKAAGSKISKILQAKRPYLSAVGITNQRETSVAWNKVTGVPYFNAIVWDDTRTTQSAHDLAAGNIDRLRAKTGLPLASYFAGTKVKWLLDHVSALREDLNDAKKCEQVAFGTIDSWLVYNLTGQQSTHENAMNCGGLHCTDVSNASRWLFMDLQKQKWDQDLVDFVCRPHILPVATALPTICPSSHVYATCDAKCGVAPLRDVPLAAVLGDQQAALFGQAAFSPGEAKNTYGTGLFLMMATGTQPVPSRRGLLTTVAYQIGKDSPVQYALEGSVSHSGSTVRWLRDNLGIIQSASQVEKVASTVRGNDGLYFVPAFSGLFAPHWRSDARACIVGLTATHTAGHLCRAALEAAAYQTREVLEAIQADAGVSLSSLAADGGATANNMLMQFQADMIDVPVVKPVVMETTAMGAAFCAGLAVGVWKDLAQIKKLWAVAETFRPTMAKEERHKNYKGWQKAISKSYGWIDEDGDDVTGAFDDGTDYFQDALDEVPQSARSLFGGKNKKESFLSPIDDEPKATDSAGFSTLFLVGAAGAALAAGFMMGRSKRY